MLPGYICADAFVHGTHFFFRLAGIFPAVWAIFAQVITAMHQRNLRLRMPSDFLHELRHGGGERFVIAVTCKFSDAQQMVRS